MNAQIDLWKHRRSLAYMATGGLLALTAAVFFGEVDTAAADLGKALAYAFAGIVLGYTGGAVVDDINARLKNQTK